MGYRPGLPQFFPELTGRCDPQLQGVIAKIPPGAGVRLYEFLSRHRFEAVTSQFRVGPSTVFATLKACYASSQYERDIIAAKLLSNRAFFLASVFGWLLRFLEPFLKNNTPAHRLAFGVYCTATKQ